MPTSTTTKTMAPRPARNREIDYSNVGTTGRRTGITLKERQRDEHGFEVIDGSMFESPEKSPAKRPTTNGIIKEGQDATVDGSQSMEIQDGTIPEPPTEVITSNRKSLRNSGVMLPPPRSRSPIKTSIGSSPRRTPAVRSSPSRAALDSTPSRPSLTATGPKRRLDFSRGTPRASVTESPRRQARVNGITPSVNGAKSKADEKAYEDEVPDFSEPEDSMAMVDPGSALVRRRHTNGFANGDYGVGDDVISDPLDSIDPALREEEKAVDTEEAVPGYVDDAADVVVVPEDDEYDSENEYQERNEEEGQDDDEAMSPEKARPRQKRRSSLIKNSKPHAKPHSVPQSSPSTQRKTIASRPADRKGKERATLQAQEPEYVRPSVETKKRQRERKTMVFQDSDAEEAPRLTKKARTRGLKPKDPNVKTSTRQSKEVDEMVEKIRSRPKQPHSLYILRRETPDVDGVTHTRSGRLSVRPLAYWRNERCIYGSGEAGEGERFPLATIKEVIRSEEVDAVDRRQNKRGKKGRNTRRRRAEERIEERIEEEEEEMEEWETEPGRIDGEVFRWDPIRQETIDDTDEIDIAYSHPAMETHEVKNATFRYAKMLRLPFFGCGIVDLPPGGVKHTKNSRKMHLCFFVFEGRVVVEVADTTFGIGKGGLWQVPRGNFYSIRNETDRPARIFFSQGCEPSAGEVD